jgi:hypothetical protein
VQGERNRLGRSKGAGRWAILCVRTRKAQYRVKFIFYLASFSIGASYLDLIFLQHQSSYKSMIMTVDKGHAKIQSFKQL